jgi:hypothetical protein
LRTIVPDDGGWVELIQGTNFPGLVLLGVAGIPGVFYLVRWMVKLQREFTDVYIEENKKLRLRLDELETEGQTKDKQIVELLTKVGSLENQVAHLNDIIDRRKMT